jgi:acyl-coenzyme A thioesterase PaaI-like protein
LRFLNPVGVIQGGFLTAMLDESGQVVAAATATVQIRAIER